MSTSDIGVVVIGRNEGERLKICLQSLLKAASKIVYVDSGSQDNSVQMAKGMGINVVELDLTIPFTAARARNTGFQWLLNNYPDINYVQFVDGDCEINSSWLTTAKKFLDEQSAYAVAFGRRRERYPEKSIYNLLCDMEWNTPVGDAKACGGDALMRVAALAAVEGYRDDLIAGEEPELCVRLRAAGWRIRRLAEEMTLHDAAITRFSQWWKRAQRGGYAFAEGFFLHGATRERFRVKESRSPWLWGCFIPVVAISVAFFKGMAGWSLLLVYPLQVGRLALRGEQVPRNNWLRAFFLVLGKFPELLGQLQFIWNRLAGRKGRLIEYK
ncbi:glycosyltransferase [Methylobacter marinus]|uniref:glycosyltransferase n=1 Tax=Methylobacter marinus TaxID=34058 RepID=UPI0003A47101|nr:glycosyltransferase [Methylobacter marinus]